MRIEAILKGIKESQPEKTASETPAPAATEKTASAPVEALKAAVSEALTASAPVKTAAASPVQDIVKVASEIAASEKEASLKEAQLLGTAFADAAIARFQEWNKVAQAIPDAPVKTAAAAPAPTFNKFAQENPELVRQAAEIGYQSTRAELEKQAETSFVAGYNDTVDRIHKIAADEFAKAAVLTNQLLHAAAQQAQA